MLSYRNRNVKRNRKAGFTIVELLVVIAVIAILAGVAIFGYGAWRNQLASDAIKSDLTAAATAMEDARNFESGYPANVPSSYSASDNSTVTYILGDNNYFCLEGRSKLVSGISYFIDSSKGNQPIQGTCRGGEGVTPDWTIFVYDTTMAGCAGTTVQVPISSPSGSSGGLIDWGDGTSEAFTAGLQSHTYATPGEKTVKYKGPITAINTTSILPDNRPCLKEVRQWADNITPTSMRFWSSTNLQHVAPPPTSVTNMSYMFYGATTFNGNINSWNTSNVTNMANMFQGAKAFNRPLSSWDTSKVTSMSFMFYDADAFNQSINSWNTSNVTNMSYMFYLNNTFNQPIGSWDTSKVTDMKSMFYSAVAFNQSVGSWNTSNVTNMSMMFRNASSFNQTISSWDTSKVTNMDYMFSGAVLFNSNLSGWNVAAVVSRPPVFFDSNTPAWVLPKPIW